MRRGEHIKTHHNGGAHAIVLRPLPGAPFIQLGFDFLTPRTRKGCPTFSVFQKVEIDENGFTILILKLPSTLKFKNVLR